MPEAMPENSEEYGMTENFWLIMEEFFPFQIFANTGSPDFQLRTFLSTWGTVPSNH